METIKWGDPIYQLKGHEVDKSPTDIALKIAIEWAKGSVGKINRTGGSVPLKGIVMETPKGSFTQEFSKPTFFRVYTEIPEIEGQYMEKRFKIEGYNIFAGTEVRFVDKLPDNLITES